MRIAMTTNEVNAFIKDTDFSNHEIIGDSVSCNRMMIDLYKPIIRFFMVFYCQRSMVNSCHLYFDYIDFKTQTVVRYIKEINFTPIQWSTVHPTIYKYNKRK